MALLRTLVVLVFLLGWSAGVLGDTGVIQTSGKGQVERRPDGATVRFVILSRAEDALAAAEATAQKHDRVVEALRPFGYDIDEVITTHFRVDEQWDRSRRNEQATLVGHTSKHGFYVDVEDFTIIGKIVDVAIGAGATKLTNIRFWSSEAEQARDEALRKATERAMRKAEIMSEAAGGALGGLIELSTGSHRVIEASPDDESGSAASVPTTIVPGKITYRAQVSGKWAFRPIE